MEALVREKVAAKFPQIAETITVNKGMPVLTVPAADLVAVCAYLHDAPELGFNYLANLTAVDYPENFQLVYHLTALRNAYTICLKVNIPKDAPVVPSVSHIWRAANWQEREVYDLFGITFSGHPDLRRILLYEGWKGYPLRKDYQDQTETRG